MPNTVITKGDKDFKFTIDPETNQGIYYSKPAGDKDASWTIADKEDDAGQLEKVGIGSGGKSGGDANFADNSQNQQTTNVTHITTVKSDNLPGQGTDSLKTGSN